MAKVHRKRRRKITQGMRTGLLILAGCLLFYILIWKIWGC